MLSPKVMPIYTPTSGWMNKPASPRPCQCLAPSITFIFANPICKMWCLACICLIGRGCWGPAPMVTGLLLWATSLCPLKGFKTHFTILFWFTMRRQCFPNWTLVTWLTISLTQETPYARGSYFGRIGMLENYGGRKQLDRALYALHFQTLYEFDFQPC